MRSKVCGMVLPSTRTCEVKDERETNFKSKNKLEACRDLL